jgi:hypothetical protein
MRKISTAIASAAASSDSARDYGIWTISSRPIARRVRSEAKLPHATMAIPITTIASPGQRHHRASGQAGAYPGKKGSLVRRVVGVVRDH